MAISIVSHQEAPQGRVYSPTPEVINTALHMVTEEREQLIALGIVLLNRMADAEAQSDFTSTELALMQVLEERLTSTSTLKALQSMLTGRAQ